MSLSGFPIYFPSCQVLDIAGGAGGAKLVKKTGLKGNKAGSKKEHKGRADAADSNSGGSEEEEADNIEEHVGNKDALLKSLMRKAVAKLSLVRSERAYATDQAMANMAGYIDKLVEEVKEGNYAVFEQLLSELSVKQLRELQGIEKHKKFDSLAAIIGRVVMKPHVDMCLSKKECAVAMKQSLDTVAWLAYTAQYAKAGAGKLDHAKFQSTLTDLIVSKSIESARVGAEPPAPRGGLFGFGSGIF